MNSLQLKIRSAQLTDLQELQLLFVNTISRICKDDYSPEQIKAWTSSVENVSRWKEKLERQYFLVAETDHQIAGFASLENNDHLDFLYVHHGFQKQGIASILLKEIETEAIKRGATILTSDVSLTARPFFEGKDFKTVSTQINQIHDLEIVNFKMIKELETPLVNRKYLLEKFQGKGGWTYVVIPEVLQNKKNPFGWVTVKGSIDSHEIKNYRLMPMGNGRLFLPVKAEIRKKIGKQEGDFVQVKLYADHSPREIPEELLLCLMDDPQAHQTFLSYPDGEQRAFIDWIYSAKKEDTKVERIARTLNKLSKGQRFMDK